MDNPKRPHAVSPYVMPGVFIKAKNPTIELIKEIVCIELKIPIHKLCIKSRERDIVFARQIATWVMKNRYRWLKSAEIAEALGYDDRTTITYNLSRIEHDIEHHDGTKELIERIMKQLK